jgi:zinc protease
MSEQAILLGLLETVGLSWALGDQLVGHIKSVTADEIQAVAKKYFVPTSRTIAELVPQKMGASQNGQQ